MDKIHNELINMNNRSLPQEAPPDTGLKSEHTDMIEKTDESGFVNYLSGK